MCRITPETRQILPAGRRIVPKKKKPPKGLVTIEKPRLQKSGLFKLESIIRLFRSNPFFFATSAATPTTINPIIGKIR
jgi:hypothetical protein